MYLNIVPSADERPWVSVLPCYSRGHASRSEIYEISKTISGGRGWSSTLGLCCKKVTCFPSSLVNRLLTYRAYKTVGSDSNSSELPEFLLSIRRIKTIILSFQSQVTVSPFDIQVHAGCMLSRVEVTIDGFWVG
jgi:hypothetical protein